MMIGYDVCFSLPIGQEHLHLQWEHVGGGFILAWNVLRL